MAKTKKSNKRKVVEKDSTFFFKLLMYLIIGSLWIKIDRVWEPVFAVPLGLLIGLLFVRHDHFKIDRKIEYAILLIAATIGYFQPVGIFISTM